MHSQISRSIVRLLNRYALIPVLTGELGTQSDWMPSPIDTPSVPNPPMDLLDVQ